MYQPIYAKRAELSVIVIEKTGFTGGQVFNTAEVDNYPGLPGVSGFDLSTKFREHCERLGAEFVDGQVVDLNLEGDIKLLTLADGSEYRSKALVIAGGGKSRTLDVKGESDLTGAGVSYCATCDGASLEIR